VNFTAKLDRWVAPLRRKVEGMVGKAVLQAVNDAPDLQVVKLSLFSETHADVERVQNFGFTSRPPVGSQAVVLFVGGRRDNPVVVACDDGRVRVKLQEGEAAMYGTSGAIVKCGAGGKVMIGNATVELLDLLDQSLSALEVAAVAPGGGPLLNAAAFTAIKTLLASLKGTL
jgi:phage gp45-like